jgi:hypothetical protein
MLAVLVVGGNLSADEAVTFRHKMSKGDSQIYRTTSVMKQTQTIGDSKIETKAKQTAINVLTLDKTDDDGNLHTNTETKQFKFKMNIEPLGDYTYDSQAAEQETGTALSAALNPVFDLLSAASFNVTVSPRGEVKAVEGYKELFGELLKDNPLAAQFAGGGSDEAAKLTLSDRYVIFSEKPVKPGDSWESEYNVSIPGIGTVKEKRIYTYEKPDKVGDVATAKITIAYEITIEIDLKANGTQITGSLSTNNASGTAQFDPEKGRMVSMKSNYTVSGDLAISVNGTNQTISTSQTHTTELQLLDKLPE